MLDNGSPLASLSLMDRTFNYQLQLTLRVAPEACPHRAETLLRGNCLSFLFNLFPIVFAATLECPLPASVSQKSDRRADCVIPNSLHLTFIS
ncbi:hypothetical protein CDAR_407331 [Caerostris darwini]|uniref:Uncharacterized protein n=1 Tax=Caerostris darwini TaxID=1538125 RepID=A0AAV4PZV2_9ARAC|nr:hypothetical protein CDAR_407331 [Caerostris darwini]